MRGEGGGRKALFCYFLFFGVALLIGGWGVVGWGKSYLVPAEISSFFSRDLSRRNKHDSFWFVELTGYFHILFLWAIVVSDFLPLEIHKHLVLPLSSITFTANSQVDKHFYKYIYLFLLFQWLYSNGLQKKLKMVYIVYFKWSTVKTLYRKTFFSVDWLKINELHVAHTWCHMQSE